jgi:hypothetical protein
MKAPDDFGSIAEAVDYLLHHTDACMDSIEKLEDMERRGFTFEQVLPHLEGPEVSWALSGGFEDWVGRLPVEKMNVDDLEGALEHVPGLRKRLPRSVLCKMTETDWIQVGLVSGTYSELAEEGRVPEPPETPCSVKELSRFLKEMNGFQTCLNSCGYHQPYSWGWRWIYSDDLSGEEFCKRIRGTDISLLCRLGMRGWMETFPLERIELSRDVADLVVAFPDLAERVRMDRISLHDRYHVLYRRPELHPYLDLTGLAEPWKSDLKKMHPFLVEAFREADRKMETGNDVQAGKGNGRCGTD